MHELPLSKQDHKPAKSPDRWWGFIYAKPFHQGLIVGIGSLLCLLIFLVSVTPKRYNLSVGMVPNQTIAANKDVVDEVTTLRNREQAASGVTPVYHFQEGVADQVMLNLESVYAQMLAVRQFAQSLSDYGPNRVYTVDEFTAAHNILNLVPMKDFQIATLMNTPEDQFDEMYASLNPAIRNTMQGNVTQSQESVTITSIMQIVGFKTNVNLLQNVVLPLLRAIIQPNMVVDEDATEAARQAAWEAVEPVIYQQGQNIVVAGEGRIKENQIEMLDSLGLLSNTTIDYTMYIGASLIVSCILLLLAVFLSVFCKSVYQDIKRLLIVYITAVLTLALSLLAKSLDAIYLASLLLPYMLLTVTLGVVPALILGTATTLIAPLMLTSGMGAANLDMTNLFVMTIFAGTLTAVLLHKRYQRSYILFSGGIASAFSFLIVLAIGLMTSVSLSTTVYKALFALAGTAISSLLCLSLQPAAESLFNLPTPMRLLDLTNPNHPLMRRLLMEAPGTYHHSIIIANLAETAAEAVGANPLLARAGAYFHDIGKLRRPLYFKENQIGSGNIHDTTSPQVSAAIIVSHVREGIALAKQHRLPYEIQQIIAEHHGGALVSFFYHKALQEADGKPIDEADYRYPGVPPQTAEGALIMLCDTIEAAVRTLSNPTPDEIVAFIEELIQKKVQSGMLVNAPLTLHQLALVRDSCASVIYGVFHERIEYPKEIDKLPPGERLIAHLQQLRGPGKGKTPKTAVELLTNTPVPQLASTTEAVKPVETTVNKQDENGNPSLPQKAMNDDTGS
ncbi:MAG: HDIG domain-containing protein [Clostridiales bacterium]|nr:HDIG domain-containing protein [Clostridiales bacterium]